MSAVHPITYARCLRRGLRPRRPWAIAPGMAGSYVLALRGADSLSAAARLRVLLETVPRDPPALQCQRCEGGRATHRRPRTAAKTGSTERRRGLEGRRTDPEAIQTIPGEIRIPEELQTIPGENRTIPEAIQRTRGEIQRIPEELQTTPGEIQRILGPESRRAVDIPPIRRSAGP